MKSVLALALVAALTIVPAYVGGSYTNRWGVPADLTQAAEKLQEFPKKLGEWEFVEEGDELTPRVIEELGLASYLSRTYENQRTGKRMNLTLMAGQPGKLLRHPPDICYANRDNRQLKREMMNVSSGGNEHQFRLLTYDRPSAIPPIRFQVAYGFFDDQRWAVPNDLRMKYGGKSVLHKLQALSTIESEDGQSDKALEEFLAEVSVAFRTVD